MPEDFPHFCGVETAVVLPPPSQKGAVVSREGRKILSRLAGQRPLGNLLSHPRLGLAAGAGQEARKEFSRAILRPARPKRKAEEGKLHRGIVAPAIAVLAVDNPRLVRMQLQPALPQASGESLLHLLGLPLRAAMHDPIIRIARKRARRQLPSQPAIQGIVQEELQQQRSEDTPLRRAPLPRLHLARLSDGRGLQPALYVEQYPPTGRVLTHRLHQQPVVQIVKGTSDVKLDHPVILPAPLPRDRHRVLGRLARTIAVRVPVKVRLQLPVFSANNVPLHVRETEPESFAGAGERAGEGGRTGY